MRVCFCATDLNRVRIRFANDVFCRPLLLECNFRFLSSLVSSWAVSTVMTRQNSLPACLQPAPVDDDETAVAAAPPTGPAVRPALIPLWDMANHCDGRVTNVFSVAEQRVEGGALRDFQKGEQIFIYYGDRRNRDFLVHNGYELASALCVLSVCL